MLKKILLLILLSTPVFAADDPVELPPASAPSTRACDIRVEFGSYSTGIDAKVYQDVMKRIVANKDITEKHVENLSRTGERALCLIVPDETKIADTYEDLKATMPFESKFNWERITTRTGLRYATAKSHEFIRPEDYN